MPKKSSRKKEFTADELGLYIDFTFEARYGAFILQLFFVLSLIIFFFARVAVEYVGCSDNVTAMLKVVKANLQRGCGYHATIALPVFVSKLAVDHSGEPSCVLL